tara:strand:+ start:1793 stop:2032 length:240 start_codon:yes stop_codon:yes gene_type:complete
MLGLETIKLCASISIETDQHFIIGDGGVIILRVLYDAKRTMPSHCDGFNHRQIVEFKLNNRKIIKQSTQPSSRVLQMRG